MCIQYPAFMVENEWGVCLPPACYSMEPLSVREWDRAGTFVRHAPIQLIGSGVCNSGCCRIPIGTYRPSITTPCSGGEFGWPAPPIPHWLLTAPHPPGRRLPSNTPQYICSWFSLIPLSMAMLVATHVQKLCTVTLTA